MSSLKLNVHVLWDPHLLDSRLCVNGFGWTLQQYVLHEEDGSRQYSYSDLERRVFLVHASVLCHVMMLW
jgi:hypothetical protein